MTHPTNMLDRPEAYDPFLSGIRRRLPGEVLCVRISGSYGYNLGVDGSDIDYQIVYAAPSIEMLSMRPPKETIDGKAGTGEWPADFQAHEVGKFCRLLVRGNPNLLESVSARLQVVRHVLFQRLHEERKRFYSKESVEHYIGYCKGQLFAMTNGKPLHSRGGKYNPKWAVHCVRLAWEAERLSRGQDPRVFWEDAEQSALMSIRRGEWSRAQVEAAVLDAMDKIEERKPWPLPDVGDEAYLKEWLLEVRREFWPQEVARC